MQGNDELAGIKHVECRDICDMEIIVNSPEIRECLVSKAEEFLENIQGLTEEQENKGLNTNRCCGHTNCGLVLCLGGTTRCFGECSIMANLTVDNTCRS